MPKALPFLLGACPAVLSAFLTGCTATSDSRPARPKDAAMDSWHLRQIDHVVSDGLSAGCMPGCVVLVGRPGETILQKAYGLRQVQPSRQKMTADTVFDVASLTKPVATATSILVLADRGLLDLDEAAASYVPEFAAGGKDAITIRQLLTHEAGLPADNPLRDYDQGPQKAWERICKLRPCAEPGRRFIYSDVGYIVLAEVVRRVAGRDLHAFTRENVFAPVGMSETGFLPAAALRRRCAPTLRRGGRWMKGQVHDPRAWRLGGVAGHAGLFSTARDLARFAEMMLRAGRHANGRVLSERAVREMTRPHTVSGGLRGLGWDIRSGYSANRGEALSRRAFGHGGFTGTSLWIDPELDLFVVFLSNRLHPDGRGEVNALAGRIATIAAAALRLPALEAERASLWAPAAKTRRAAKVLTGLDVLRRDGFRPLAGRRVGLIANHTSLSREGTHAARLLAEAPNVTLVKLFSPEHGFEGRLDEAHVADGRDPTTNLPVLSLYGETRTPTKDMLADIDTLVFDVQDVGTRFYTYISTLGCCMQAAAEHGLRFVVLDRPNPVNGLDVAGPVLDAGRESFVGFHRLPVRHGLTVGELAGLFRAELKLPLDLHVVRMEGWRRDMLHDATGLRWVNPSPNMRSLTEALLYPGIGLLEATNLSVGRGTETPFEVIGAPWLEERELAASLNASGLPGVRFAAIRFQPLSSKYAGSECGGVRITLTDRGVFRPIRTGLEIARCLRSLHGRQWRARAVDRLLANRRALDGLLAGKTVTEIQWGWQEPLTEFMRRRSAVLLYDRPGPDRSEPQRSEGPPRE
jgi:uncharacterized protein YbbC (DUF1343 family)/CubicO group peptidase (beta-lactamase class C family)